MREHARFLALVGAAPIVVGGILTTIGIAQATNGDLWGTPWFFWGIIVVGLGVGIELVAVGMYVGSRETVAVSGGARRRRVPLTMTPVQLTQPFHAGYTDVQARNMTRQYLGKPFRVTGPVKNVYRRADGATILLDEGELDGRSVFLYFGRRWRARLEAMSPGDTVAVVGKIREVDGYTVKVSRCRLVDQ